MTNHASLSKSELAALDYLIALAEEENNPKLLTATGAMAAWVAAAREIAKEVGRAAVAAGVAEAVGRMIGGNAVTSEADLRLGGNVEGMLARLSKEPTIEEIKALRAQLGKQDR